MKINLNWLQLHTGLGSPVLESSLPINYISENWFLHLRDFLLNIKGSIRIQDQWHPSPERRGDSILMDCISKIESPTT